jgi:O-antigen biosynthesis protein
MIEFSGSMVLEKFSSAFVDETLFIERLGGSKTDPNTISRYMSLPIAARPDVSVFFDRAFYWQTYPDIKAIAFDPLVHFIGWGVAEKRTPHPLVDVGHIARQNPDLLPDPPTAEALHALLCRDLMDPGRLFSLDFYREQLGGSEPEGGLLRHFLEDGILRGLKPNASFDPLTYYRRIAGKTFDIRSSLRFYAIAGAAAQQEATNEPASEGQAKALFRAKAGAAQVFHARSPLCLYLFRAPDLSVIMVVHDNFALTLLALASLRANYPGPMELILIDSGSTDETRHLAQYVRGARLLRFDTNISFVRGCNAGLSAATADAVLYLNNDVELAEGAVANALCRLRSDDTIGAVGAKVIRAHGLLQEAGCIIWRDGWTVGYQRDESPLVPEANFVRDVDFCSAVFLLARTSVLRMLNGFDDAFAPAYFEDADLCVRVRDTGYRIVYDPSVAVHHLEYGTSQDAAHQRIKDARQIFLEKHQDTLRLAHTADVAAQVFARSVNQMRSRILLIEDQLPLRRLGSGFGRSNDVVRAMARLGHHVTVFPIHPNTYNLAAVYGDFPDTVEVMHDRSLKDLERFLTDRHGYYNTIWIARTHNLDLIRPILEKIGLDAPGSPRVVLDTEAVSTNREAQKQARLVLQTCST